MKVLSYPKLPIVMLSSEPERPRTDQPLPLLNFAARQVDVRPEVVTGQAPQTREIPPLRPHAFCRTDDERLDLSLGGSRNPNTGTGEYSYADNFMSLLAKHFPKNPTVKTTERSVPELLEILRKFLEQELAENTWTNYGRSWAEFQRFLVEKNLLPTNSNAAMFITGLHDDLERRKTLEINGIFQYAKDISAVGGRLPVEVWTAGGSHQLSKVMYILVKMGAKIPHSKAKPLTRAHAYSVLTRRGWTEEQRMVIYAMWKTASRDVDIVALSSLHCRQEKEDETDLIVFEWVPSTATGPGSGRTKNSRGRVQTCVVNAGEYTDRLWAYINHRQQRRLPFTSMTESQIVTLLQKLDPEYGGHSVKRGALTELARCRAPFELIGRVARHHNPARDLPELTQGYLDIEVCALLSRTQDATKLL